MIHSYSSLSDWRQCPRHYKAKWVDKTIRFESSPEAERGIRLHKAMDKYLQGKQDALPDGYKGHPGWPALLRKAEAKSETPIAITRNGCGCNFFDKENVWLRGKIDVYKGLFDKKLALMVDWKTGNPKYTDDLQADVYAAMICSSTVLERVLFVWSYFTGENKSSTVVGSEAKKRVERLIDRVEADDKFVPVPSWKCRFCQLTSCEYNRS
jgi:hypothetical protein